MSTLLSIEKMNALSSSLLRGSLSLSLPSTQKIHSLSLSLSLSLSPLYRELISLPSIGRIDSPSLSLSLHREGGCLLYIEKINTLSSL